MDILQKAKRVNAAYETVYGPDNLLNAPITRDLAANHVIERRSQFPAIATAEYFNAPQYNILHTNINLTRGIDLRGRESFRPRAMPGDIALQSSFGISEDEQDNTTNWLMYGVGLLFVIGLFVIIF